MSNDSSKIEHLKSGGGIIDVNKAFIEKIDNENRSLCDLLIFAHEAAG